MEEYKTSLTDIHNSSEEAALMFGNFLETHSLEKQYYEITDKEKLILVINEYIDEFNQISKNKIDIVLF